MNYFTKIITLGFVALSFVTFGQLSNQQTINPFNNSSVPEKCGTRSLHLEKMNTDVSYRQRMEAFELYTHSDHERVSQTNLKVPVVVHVISDGTSLTDITDAQIEQAILAMNQMYRKVPGTKGDGDGVDVGFEFALAVRDPDGNCTSGITRYDHSGDATYAANGVFRNSAGISDASLKSLVVWEQTHYYNIWLVSEIDGNNGGAGIQGYATLAGSHGGSSDGAVILANNFENVESTTGVHEIGHSFNLYHTFEGDDLGCPDDADCTTDGDLVCDTPPHERSSSDCVVGANGCDGGSSTELFIHNYMDYSSDACQNMFTQGQKDRMIDAINNMRSSYLASNGNMALVPPEVANVNFSASSAGGCLGTTVSFKDLSSCTPNTFMDTTSWAGITFSWTFDNNAGTSYTSTLQNPVITFANAGTYDVTLEVTNPSGTTSFTQQGSVVITSSVVAADCNATSSYSGGVEYGIFKVILNTINHSSGSTTTDDNNGLTTNGYGDFSCSESTVLQANTSYDFSVEGLPYDPGNGQDFKVYIDYNNNGDFTDPGEEVLSWDNTSPPEGLMTQSFTTAVAPTLNTLLRMRVIASRDSETITPCMVTSRGQVHDFGVYFSNLIASVSISTAPSNVISYGTSTTFTATPVNGGAAPTYAWYLNGVVVGGEIGSTYNTSTLVDGDEVYCVMTSNLAGVIASPATSNIETMTVTGAPLSDFSASQNTACASNNIQFTDESLLAPTSWSWTFTGGTPNVSSSENPSVSYAAPGTYEVILTATNGFGAGTTETKTDYITISASPVAICDAFSRANAATSGIGLTNVKLNDIDNITAYDDAVFNDYSCSQITTLEKSTNYDISAKVGSFNAQWLRVYIDYNNNGSFEGSELVFSPANGTNLRSGSFMTPASPTEDELLRMRVITDFVNTAPGACTSPLDYGQVEDYGVMFTSSCTAPSIDVEPNAEVVCENSNSTFSVTASGTSLVYLWEESTDGIVFNGLSDGGIYSGVTTPNLTLTNTPIANDSYEYRCAITSACGDVTSSEVTLTVNTLDDASFSYASVSYCLNDVDPSVTITGLAGGGFTSAPAGLSINAGSGLVDVSTSTVDDYTVTYTTVGACPNSADVSLSITNVDDASFNYSAVSFCDNSADESPTITGVAGGGFTSAPAGLVIDAGSGLIDFSASTPGTYTVTYTTAGSCANSSDETVKIFELDDASFNYSAAAYCADDSNPSPTITGLAGGGFTSAPAGLSINASSGKIDLESSTAGTYTVTYTTTGSCPNSSGETVTVNSLDDAGFNYSAPSYCINDIDPSATITGLAGGGFSSAPAGLVINAGTGSVDVSASTQQAYVVTYTTSGTCPNSSDVNLSITNVDDASFNYSSVSFCANAADESATITGVAGGGFTFAPAGLVIDAGSGLIDFSASTPGTYTVTYTTTGSCANSSDETVKIFELDDASFNYSAAAYCVDESNPAANITGDLGGTFSSAPAGMTINETSGKIDLLVTSPGTYTVTYTTSGSCPNSSGETVTVNALDDAGFNYSEESYCINDVDPSATITGLAGGEFGSSPAGLVFNAASGLIDVSASTPGTYTVTYTTTGSCVNSSDKTVAINALDDASFSYALNSYETGGVDPTPTITGLAGGTFSSLPIGLDINPVSGEIDLSNSLIDDYIVTYTTSGGCVNTETFNISIINSVPLTTIQPQYCGQVVSSLNQAILSIHVPGATNYRYRITPTDLSAAPLVYTRNSHSYSMKLAWYGNGVILYNTSYQIEVAVFVGGTWSDYGNSCEIITPVIPETKLQNAHCGNIVSGLDQAIFADQVPGATNYKYRATPTDLSAASVEYVRNSESYSMKLEWFGAGVISYNTSYEIEVSAFVEGSWTAYGATCQVITPAIPVALTKLKSVYCGAMVSTMNQSLLAVPVSGATNYKYRATPTDLSSASIEYVRNSSSYSMKLAWFGNGAIFYNTSYQIEVASFVDGSWTAYGDPCEVITPAIPQTKLQNVYCGQVVTSLYQALLAVHVPGATNYKYRATPSDLSSASVEYVRNSHSYSVKLAWFGNGVILDNTSYEIEVSAYVDGAWTAYGDACQVITPAPPSSQVTQNTGEVESSNDLGINGDSKTEVLEDEKLEEVEELTFSIFPNPTTGLFTLQSDVNEVRFRIVSIDGRLVHPPAILTNGSKTIDLSFVEKGVYLVVLEKGNQQLIKRVIVN